MHHRDHSERGLAHDDADIHNEQEEQDGQGGPDEREDVDELEVHRGMPAMTLAEAFMDTMHISDEDERAEAMDAILCAGQLIAELDGPGRWEAFDAAEYVGRIGFMGRGEIIGHLFSLAGFFGWMGILSLMEAESSARILREIAESSPPEPILQSFCRRSADAIEEPSPSGRRFELSA